MIWVHEYGSESEEDVDYYCGMVGTTEMLPLLDYLDAEKFIVDYDGNGSITADELNANIGIDVAVGKGMELVTVSEFQEGDPNGEMSFYYPDAFIKMVSKDAAGEKITFTFTNKKTGASETYEVVVRLADIARGETKIVSTPEGELVQNGYGNYVLMVESGASVTITPGYTTLDGEKADVTINWYILDHEAGRTTEEPLYTGSSYTYTNVQAGRNYGWDVIAKDENGNEYIVETRWVSVQPPVVEYQTVTVKGIPADAVTEELAQIPSLDTPAKIETEVITTVYAKALEKWADVPTENVAAYEVSLVYSEDGLNWEEVNADNWPADLTSLTVRLPYPAGTSAANEFIVAHMFATSVNGKTPGTFEYPAVRKYSDHIEFEVTGLSPISVAWREPVPAAAPNTGDSSTPVLWLLGMLIAGAGCVAMMRKRRQNG